MSSFSFKGLEDLNQELERLAQNAENAVSKYDGQNVALEEMFTNEFLHAHTHPRYDDFDSWLKAGGFNFDSQEEYDELAESGALDPYVKQSTDFATFQEMLEVAVSDMVSAELFD